MNPLTFLQPYLGLIKLIAIVAAFAAITAFAIHVRNGYIQQGRDEVQAKWDKEELAEKTAALVAEADARKREHDAQTSANNAQQGAETAVKGVYDYFAKNPHVVYRTKSGGVSYLPGDCGATDSTPSNARTATGTVEATTDNGHAPAIGEGEVQIIEPDLVARCAVTTTLFLTLQSMYNDVKHSINGE